MSAFLSFSRHCANERNKTLVLVTLASPTLGKGLANICQSRQHRDSTCWGLLGMGLWTCPGAPPPARAQGKWAHLC